ncbi:MAG: YdcF family protein [Deltaproteobacteria bacterium]|nr:YdcF family protein [Deltaproteobacteria bacterium]
MKRAGLIAALAVSFALAIYLFLDFTAGIKAGNAEPADTGVTDAIVVLTGGMGRVEEGLSLLRKGKAGLLVLSGVHADADLDSIFLNHLDRSERPRIVLEKKSGSTFENAVEVKRFMEERGLKSMVLITSVYHMKRAEYIFRRIMPPDIRIEPYRVSTPNFDEEKWWQGRSLMLLLIEFLKYYWYAAGFAVGAF